MSLGDKPLPVPHLFVWFIVNPTFKVCFDEDEDDDADADEMDFEVEVETEGWMMGGDEVGDVDSDDAADRNGDCDGDGDCGDGDGECGGLTEMNIHNIKTFRIQ